MDISNKNKKELLEICEKLNIKKCKSKNKLELIKLINDETKDEITNEITNTKIKKKHLTNYLKHSFRMYKNK